MLNLGETFPNFVAPSTLGGLDFYEYLGSSWGMVFSHPADYTPVCTTEIARMSQLHKEFEKRNVKAICLSIDTVEDHTGWVEDVKKVSGCQVPFPIVGDEKGTVAEQIGMLDKSTDKRVTVRGVFVLDPEKKVKAVICYPTSTGRNFDEIIRLIDSLQLTAQRPDVVTPVDWKQGGDLIVKPGCQVEGATTVELPSGKDYLRYVKQ
ncbi:Peroxiredoxin-6 [Halotydeus destructor]|nr:Peroxiredoxin-6 [Halotydeus destructor]